mgnify:CR=1 FL=1
MMMTRSFTFLVLIVAVMLNSSIGSAKNDKAKGKANKNKHKQTESVAKDVANLINPNITSREIRSILEGYNVPRGSALPPGIAKNLARGKPLPPGIAKKSFPRNHYKKLPYYDGYEWVRAGTSMILVGVTSRVIAKVLERVFD